MSSLQEIADTLRQQIQQTENKCSSIEKLKSTQRQQALVKCQKQIKRTKNLLKTYQFSIQDCQGESGIEGHKSQAQEFEKKLVQLEKNLQYTRSEGVREDDLFKHRIKDKPEGRGNERQEMIQLGHKTQEQGMEALKRINKNIIVMDEQADAVNLELDRQINQLDKIYDDLQDTQTTLKRAEKHLKYFARQVYTDKLMMCLIVVIILAIIVIIILSAIGMTPESAADTLK